MLFKYILKYFSPECQTLPKIPVGIRYNGTALYNTRNLELSNFEVFTNSLGGANILLQVSHELRCNKDIKMLAKSLVNLVLTKALILL